MGASNPTVAATIAPILAARRGRERALCELRESEERFRDITLSIGDWVWEMDREGRITYCSPQVEQILGYTVQEIVGSSPFQRMETDESARLRREFEDHIAHPRPLREATTWVRSKSGRPIAVSVSAVPFRDRRGNVTGYRGVTRDVTESLRLRDEAVRAQKLESLGVLAGGIAHDFNNVLTSIFTNTSLAKADLPAGNPARRRLAEVERSLVRARGLAQQLLTFAKGGAPVTKPSSVVELVRESVDFALSGSNVKCDLTARDDIWPVQADAGQICQVIQNLVLNAAQAMPGGGRVRIRIENTELDGSGVPKVEPGRYVRVVVRDEGIGIPERHIGRIFDPYFSTKQAGSGLGLSVTYSILRSHGGRIEVESTLGEGATFTFYLPAADGDVAADSPAAAPAPPRGRGRLLVMDDDPDVRDAIVTVLRRGGYEVEATADGEAAVRRYEEALASGRRFDAVLLDLTVPGAMGGLEAVEVLQTRDPDVRAIVTSGYSNDPVMANYQIYGFRAVVAKPFLPEDLLDTMAGVLRDYSTPVQKA